MSFMQTLRQIVGPTSDSVEYGENRDAKAAAIIAHFAPHLLRRLAEIAAVFDRPGLHSGQGAILACRGRADGYRAIEYDAPELSIAFDVINGEAHLQWRAGEEIDDRRITINTPEIVIDAALLDAASAYANRHAAALTT
jgi:hypothetical protein